MSCAMSARQAVSGATAARSVERTGPRTAWRTPLHVSARVGERDARIGSERHALLLAVILVVPAPQLVPAGRDKQVEPAGVGQFIGFRTRLGVAHLGIGQQCRSPEKYHIFRPRVPRSGPSESLDGHGRARTAEAEPVFQVSVFRRKKSIPVDRCGPLWNSRWRRVKDEVRTVSHARWVGGRHRANK